MSDYNCKICNGHLIQPIEDLFSFPNITSDCRPWIRGRSINICKKCGLASRIINKEYKKKFENIYQDYAMFDQSIVTSDQMNFTADGSCEGRTARILEFVNDIIKIYPKKILDIGCGNGAGLLALSNQYKNSNIFGFEPNDKPLDKVSSWPNNIKKIYNDRPDENEKFDLITLFHVFEHIEDIFEFIEYIKKIISQKGVVIIQVPYLINGAFDVIIADHVHHFTKASFYYFLKAVNLTPILIDNCVISKELTVVIKQETDSSISVEKEEYLKMEESVEWLIKFKKIVDIIKLANKKICVFGTGPAAAWTGFLLGENCYCYLDEDSNRVGSIFNEKIIVDPKSISQNIPIIAPFPDYQLIWIKDRFKNLTFLN